jgi:hypothetical protein
MQNNNSVFWLLLLATLTAGFISGWTIKESTSDTKGYINTSGLFVKVHDTIQTPGIEYRIIPGKSYNVDSIVNSLNQFWKDSLKNLYGKGLFESKFTKEDQLGKREISLTSRIPIDPEAGITFDEQLKLPEVYPKRTFGIFAGLSYELRNEIAGSVGLKYYLLDFRNFSLSLSAKGNYLITNKQWYPCLKLETELKL